VNAVAEDARVLLLAFTRERRRVLVRLLWRRFYGSKGVTEGCCEDAVGDAILKAQQGNPSLNNLDAWLYRVAINQMISLTRKRTTRMRVFDAGETVRTAHADAVPDAVTTIMADSSRIALREALRKLSEKERRAVWLYHYVGLDSVTCGRNLSIHPASVKMRAMRGRRALAVILQNDVRFDIASLLQR